MAEKDSLYDFVCYTTNDARVGEALLFGGSVTDGSDNLHRFSLCSLLETSVAYGNRPSRSMLI